MKSFGIPNNDYDVVNKKYVHNYIDYKTAKSDLSVSPSLKEYAYRQYTDGDTVPITIRSSNSTTVTTNATFNEYFQYEPDKITVLKNDAEEYKINAEYGDIPQKTTDEKNIKLSSSYFITIEEAAKLGNETTPLKTSYITFTFCKPLYYFYVTEELNASTTDYWNNYLQNNYNNIKSILLNDSNIGTDGSFTKTLEGTSSDSVLLYVFSPCPITNLQITGIQIDQIPPLVAESISLSTYKQDTGSNNEEIITEKFANIYTNYYVYKSTDFVKIPKATITLYAKLE